jgi:hypothetical protein
VVEFNEALVIGTAERDELVRLRQEALQAMAEERGPEPGAKWR